VHLPAHNRFLRSLPALLLLASTWGALPSAFAASFTIEQVMGSPFPSELVAAQHADRLAWIFNDRGDRNIWVADGPEMTPRQLTHYTGDNGQPIASLAITPDGNTVVYARGTELNDAGHVANPTTDPVEPKQQVWAVAVETGEPRLLGGMGCGSEDCENIQLSPDGKWAVWTAHRALWLAPVNGSRTAARLTDLQGPASQPTWSADGQRLAFTLNRGDHSFIVIADIARGAVTAYHYIAPSVDYDESPRWTADGKHIVFLRHNGKESGLPLLLVRPAPWSIWVGDAQDYTAQRTWKSGTRMRDSLPSSADDALHVTTTNRIIFDSEADGWNHLYSIALDGAGRATRLTPGEFSVKDVQIGPDGHTIFYSSNQNDLDRRHLWKVDAAGGKPPVALTQGNTIEWAPVPLEDGKLFCLGSSATTPALVYQVTQRGRQLITKKQLPADFPSAELVEPKAVIFKSSDGYTIHGQLFQPRNQHAPGPAIIFVHGGPHRQMLLGFNPMGYYHNSYAENEYLVSLGFTILSVNYRLGVMYGYDFEHAPNTYWRGASEYKDVLAGAMYLHSLPIVDPHRIGIWGGSYGGFLTAMALARNSDIFSAGVDYHGMGSLMHHVQSAAPSVLFAPDLKEAQKVAWASSPESTMNLWKSPVLLIQGDDDRNVTFHQTVNLVQKLREQHVPFEQIVFPDEIHGFLLWHHWIESYKAEAQFFEKYLNKDTKR